MQGERRQPRPVAAPGRRERRRAGDAPPAVPCPLSPGPCPLVLAPV